MDKDQLRELLITENGRRTLREVLHENGYALFTEAEAKAVYSICNYDFAHESDHYESEKRKLEEAGWSEDEIDERLQDHIVTKINTAYEALQRENVECPT